MSRATRRSAVIGASLALATTGVLSAAVASAPAGHGPGQHGPAQHGPALKPTHLTVHAPSTASGTSHYKATVVGTLRSHHTPVANETITVQQRTGSGNTWTDLGQTATTDSSGKVTFVFTQGATKEQYRLSFAGDSTYRKSHSGVVTITSTKPEPTPTPTTTSAA